MVKAELIGDEYLIEMEAEAILRLRKLLSGFRGIVL
jgi:hypothetical protein